MKNKALKIGCGVIALIISGVAVWIGPVIRDVWKAGFFEKVDREEYRAGRQENLSALLTALKLYHESEGVFPGTTEWVEAIRPRLATNGMSKTEAESKLTNPSKPGSSEVFYELNPEVAGKYEEDVTPPDTWVVRELSEKPWSIRLDGTVLDEQKGEVSVSNPAKSSGNRLE